MLLCYYLKKFKISSRKGGTDNTTSSHGLSDENQSKRKTDRQNGVP